MTHTPAAHERFLDCTHPGPEAELILVEGDSALSSVAPLRDARRQAVLALQGKPLNAWVARPERVASHPQYRQLADALGIASPIALADALADAMADPKAVAQGVAQAPPGGDRHPALRRYGRLVLLFDPDADGIHIGALMVLYVARWLPGLIECGALWQVRPPMFELIGADDGELRYASHPHECEALAAQMAAEAQGQAPRIRRFRGLGGLGGLPAAALREWGVDIATRRAHGLRPEDARAVQQALRPAWPR